MTEKITITRKSHPFTIGLLNAVQHHWSGDHKRDQFEIDMRWNGWLDSIEERISKMPWDEINEIASSDDDNGDGQFGSILNAFMNTYAGID